MEWNELFPQNKPPTLRDMGDYIGGEMRQVWDYLLNKFLAGYKVKPKICYSGCSGKPGWNVKLQKSGKTFGTLYPENNSFSVFIVIGYGLDEKINNILPQLSDEMAEMYRNADDFMKKGKWMMFRITDEEGLKDYLKIVELKMSA